MAKRKAGKRALRATSWKEADALLLVLGNARGSVAALKAEADREIAAIKSALKRGAADYLEEEKEIVAALREFALEHDGEMDGRSRKLTHGTIGFRKSTRIVLKRTAEFVLQKLRAAKMTDCIRVKEEVNKEALDTYEDGVLKDVGAQRKTQDRFFAETDGAVVQ